MVLVFFHLDGISLYEVKKLSLYTLCGLFLIFRQVYVRLQPSVSCLYASEAIGKGIVDDISHDVFSFYLVPVIFK